MKKFDLNAMGVEEMTGKEVAKTDGGSYIVVGIAYASLLAATGPLGGALAMAGFIAACYEHEGGKLW